jgi:predicted nucleotidyltransferase
MENIRAREGDFIETLEGLIFDVKGLFHPPDRVVAYVRYVEDPSGNRRRGEKTYTKVYSLEERENLLRSRYPRYLYRDPVFGELLEEVQNKLIRIHYQPAEKVSELLKEISLDQVEAESTEFIHLLHESSGVDYGKLGLSGSILVDLHTQESDIDIVVYGRKNCKDVYETLRLLIQEEKRVSSYDIEDLEKLYKFRSKDTWVSIEDFLRTERRKFSQGKFGGRDFFVRFIPDWDEVDERYGDCLYMNSGYAKIEAKVIDDSNSIFTPCRYLISGAKVLDGTNISSIKEIVSFRGRFCEQAKKGETVIAQGKMEKVIERNGTEYFRLIIGAKPSDFMTSK